MISIVIPYYNRRSLLINTLKSIEFFSGGLDVEIIIVDDGSEEKINDIHSLFPNLKIVLVVIKKNKSGWRAPAIAYNAGFDIAKGDIILLNSCDCVHGGDILHFVQHHMYGNNYLCFATLAGTEQINNFFSTVQWAEDTAYQATKQYGFQNGWWRAHKTNRILIPFCASIFRSDLEKLNGYDERFADGIGYDDCDFIDRVGNLGLNMVLVDDPYCIHQYHELVQYTNDRNKRLLEDLTKEEPKRVKAPQNKIYVR